MQDFDLLQASLEGSTLLEASAGTGKTYSLSFLYLRLLLEKSLMVDEIVVATFTKAATAELKKRIYARLLEAEDVLNQLTNNNQENQQENKDDPILVALLTQLLSVSDAQMLHKRLRLAQVQFDRAQIHSINGFALQLLREHAVTLGAYVPDDVLNDDYDMVKTLYLQLAHEDFALLGEDAKRVGAVVAHYKSDTLFSLLTAMCLHWEALQRAEVAFPDYDAEIKQTNATISLLTAVDFDRDSAVLMVQNAINEDILNKRTYKTEKVQEYAKKLTDVKTYCKDNKSFLKFFSHQQLLKNVKKDKQATFNHPLFFAFDTLVDKIDYLLQAENIAYHLLMRLVRVIRQGLSEAKAAQMVLTHDDIISIVSEGADKLILPIKAALLDESQDANTAQLILFEKLFLERGHTCFFVGDPKQAIYGFRGGDVYTYLNIRDKVDYIYRLPKNFRSTQAVNTSINTLFSANPFADTGIDYQPIAWKKDNQMSSFGQTALSLVQSESQQVEYLASVAARWVIALLSEGHYITDGKNKRSLRSGDVAILVRGATQANHMKKALADLGLAASFTGKSSVYESDEAQLFYALLVAINSGNVREIRSLMLTVLFDCQVQDLHNDEWVNTLRFKLHDCASIYLKQGFSVMFYRFMLHFNVGRQLLSLTDGKRRLSNFIQLFELLQKALQKQSLSLLGLTEWLLQRIKKHDKESELRLEDQNAVSIMTMHSSKGLEFKVVCLPFLNYMKGNSHGGVLISHSKRLATLESLIPAVVALCQQEERAEEMRLAYVALTRAMYHNMVVLQPGEGQNKSKSIWTKLNQSMTGSSTLPIDEYSFTEKQAENQHEGLYYHADKVTDVTVRTRQTVLIPKWKMASFSALQQRLSGRGYTRIVSKYHQDKRPISTLMQVVAGAKAGTALHKMYEVYMMNRQRDEHFVQQVKAILEDAFFMQSSGVKAEQLAGAIVDTASVPLSPQLFCLNDIDINRQSIEMKFFLHLTADARQHLYTYFGEDISADIEGYLHGFIDYWFEYDGQFYLLDYKSNKLGEKFSDYNRSAMQQSMDEHRYDLQALIYTLALCKHLGIHEQHDYETLIGGYYYLFIRGMNRRPATAENGINIKTAEWASLRIIL
ncbi:MAG: UvrD-helicase domain-containing protein [Ostreibacterium sp.]